VAVLVLCWGDLLRAAVGDGVGAGAGGWGWCSEELGAKVALYQMLSPGAWQPVLLQHYGVSVCASLQWCGLPCPGHVKASTISCCAA
jgi:hypothetical protein